MHQKHYEKSTWTWTAGWTLIAAFWLAAATSALSDVESKVTEVCVYRGQALVQREVRFDAKKGAQEVVVEGLPEKLVTASLFASSTEDVVVRAVSFRRTPAEENPVEAIRTLDAEIKALQQDMDGIRARQEALKREEEYLASLQNFTAPTATVEMSKGVLNPEAVVKTTEFIFKEFSRIAEERLKLKHQQEALEEKAQVQTERRAELTGGGNNYRREAVILLDAAGGGRKTLQLLYLVDDVQWSPSYVARLNEKRDRMRLEYNAVVTQRSGEDWNNVKLTLSTSHPNLRSEAQALTPFFVTLTSAGRQIAPISDIQVYQQKMQEMNQYRGGQQAQTFDSLDTGQFRNIKAVETYRQNVGQNIGAARLQNFELTVADEVIKTLGRQQQDPSGGLAVEYVMEGQLNLPSRPDQQMLRIANIDLDTEFYYNAVPLLSDYIYQVVEATNTSQYALLPGEVSTYIAGTFTGQGNLPLLSKGQRLTLGFGAETQLRVSRRMIDKQTRIHGGNQVATYKYQMTLENYMDQETPLRLWDRVPQSSGGGLTVTLLEQSSELSKDEAYQQQQRKDGLLRWDIVVPADSAGGKPFEVTYAFSLEYDKNLSIAELHQESLERIRRDVQRQMATF